MKTKHVNFKCDGGPGLSNNEALNEIVMHLRSGGTIGG